MPSEKQLSFIRYLLAKGYYRTSDWSWLHLYSRKQASALIDNLLNNSPHWREEFIRGLPEPVAKLRQSEIPMPPPKPLEPEDPQIPPEVTEFKRWATEVYQRGEQTITQLGVLYDARFGNPLASK